MKCDFSKAGILRVIPENPVEQFALSMWDKTKIEISECDWDVQSTESLHEFVTLIKARTAEYQEFLRLKDSADSAEGNQS